ncbi:MAG TPA: sigma-54-dependent Fis family transcriptional regulator [Vicinamibacterales bacterium]|nr:sigma-54-dependent Fis family transcriptional regulator [Vicinamibacterales bacterium]
MRAKDLDLRELLDFEPTGGIIRFAGDRAVLLNTVALGVLRQELVDTVGATTARGILTRFGYAHGWRTAETLKTTFEWDSPREWRLAGGRLHQLQGMLVYQPAAREPGEASSHHAESVWRDSYEAQEHLLHVGQSSEPVCWTLCGFASGYLSYCEGKRIYCVEKKCRAKGDAHCEMVGDTEEAWGEAMKGQFAFYGRECLDDSLRHVTNLLKLTEQKLAVRRRELARVEVREPKTGIVAQSEKMQAVLDQVHRVSHVDTTVLLTGESGVGKEVLARVIHEDSARAAMPFLAINCAAVPEALIESELFGHVRGAFTGATQDRVGLFEAASRGTLLLDEVGDLPAAMQVKLLRVLQEHEIRRVGENRTKTVDVRVLAATHRDLAAEVAAGRFRQDLYYRLRVIEIHIPPLRERPDDVLPMARRFLSETAARLKLPVTGLTPRAADQLTKWSWPGNVRELQNVIERAIVLARGNRIEIDDLPEEVRRLDAGTTNERRSLADVERDHIQRVLDSVGGNKTKAAAILQIGQATLFRKLKTM